MHVKGTIDSKLVLGLLDADQQSLKGLQKQLTRPSEGPNSGSAQDTE